LSRPNYPRHDPIRSSAGLPTFVTAVRGWSDAFFIPPLSNNRRHAAACFTRRGPYGRRVLAIGAVTIKLGRHWICYQALRFTCVFLVGSEFFNNTGLTVELVCIVLSARIDAMYALIKRPAIVMPGNALIDERKDALIFSI